MRLPIEIETTEDHLAFELFDTTTLAVGISIVVPGDVVLTFRGVARKSDAAGLGILRLEVGIERNASIAQAATWLCQRVGGHATVVRIAGQVVNCEPGEIERVLVERAGTTR